MARTHFSWEIDIRRLQNLMNTSNNDAERNTIQDLLTREEIKVSSPESDDGSDQQPELNKADDREP